LYIAIGLLFDYMFRLYNNIKYIDRQYIIDIAFTKYRSEMYEGTFTMISDTRYVISRNGITSHV